MLPPFSASYIWIPNIQYRGSKIQSLYAHVQWYGKRTPGTNQKVLYHHALRHLVIRKGTLGRRAVHIYPTAEASPTDCGWKSTQNCLQPDWYPGSSVPESLTCASDNMEDTSTDGEQSDNAWSDDSDDNYENDEEV